MELKKIDKSNYRECMELEVDESQKYFVADNARSLVEAAYEDGLYTLGIYDGDTMVGFILYDYDDSYPGWSMSRFMIGRQFLDYFKKKHGADRIYISVSLDNAVARKMYSDLGFREIKETEYSYSGHLYREMQMVKHL